MNIILLRHGQAKKAETPDGDAERKLTGAGKKAMRAVLQRDVNLLSTRGDIIFWTSPLIRARQTAKIFQRAIRSARNVDLDMKVQEALNNTEIHDIVSVLTEALYTDAFGSNDTLVMVGHDPQMTRLIEYLTGQKIRFQAGAHICLYLSDETRNHIRTCDDTEAAAQVLMHAAKIRWFIQGPNFADWQTMVDLEKILAHGFENVKKQCKEFTDHPDDADAVHDLRVSIRTLRSYVWFIKPFQKAKQNQRMQIQLRTLVRALSRLRELDVLAEDTKRVDVDLAPAVNGPEPPETLDAVIRRCRAAECEEVLKRFASRDCAETWKNLEKEFSRIHWNNETEQEGLSDQVISDRLTELTETMRHDYQKLDPGDVEAAHKVRKDAKKIRYNARGLKELTGPRKDVVDTMHEIQDKLGALCDARVNIDLLEELIHHEALSDLARWQAVNLQVIEKQTEKQCMKMLMDQQ